MTTEGSTQRQSDTPRRFSRRTLLVGGAVSAAAVGLGVYSTEVERHFIDVVPQTFLIPDLPDTFRGFRIAQISDIHLERFTEDFFFRKAISRINALKPDLVLITGDYISNNPTGPDDGAFAAMPHCGEILQGLECPLRFGSLGNHDVDVDSAAVVNMLTASGITPLVNRYVPIERGGKRLWVSGLDDAYAGNPDINLAVPEEPDAPVILMCHEPDFMDTIVRHKRSQHVDLVLSGHTHGGQVRLPFFGALQLPPLGEKYSIGRYRFGQTQLYVNRGIGTVGLPVRFDCPPEITHITLQRA